jgi:NADH dehydrogenase/NADH:ubiquinone oxidoreductase subunit G
MATIFVDDNAIEAPDGANLLRVCLDNGIYIPNLCYLPDMPAPPASCRLCFVEIDANPQPAAACTVGVSDGMQVRTDSPAVRRLQRSALQLLLSVHDVACKTCPANRRCALQDMARFLKVGIRVKGLEKHIKAAAAAADSHPALSYFANRCVLCGRCVHVCKGMHDHALLAFAERGFDTVISAYGAGADTSRCTACLACAAICPVGALIPKPA